MRGINVTVSIIGAGSIGLLFAAYLKRAGVDVTLYTRTEKQAKKLTEDGLYLSYDGKDRYHSVRAKTLTETSVISDETIIVTVKQHQLKDVLPCLKQNSFGKTLLFVQNGMGHLTYLQTLRHCQIILSVVEHGATRTNENTVIHTGVGQTKVAYFTETKSKTVPPFMESWVTRHFPIVFQANWYDMLAYKLVANAVINPLTAIFKVTNGTLLTNNYIRQLMRGLFTETVNILQLDDPQLWEYVVTICEQTAENQSSMFRDIQAKRKTEIDAISGYIIKRAQEHNKNVPYTTFVYNSIKAFEQLD